MSTYLFDFDGTLVDSMPFWAQKMLDILEDMALEMREMQDDQDELEEALDVISDDLAEVETYIYESEDDEDEDDDDCCCCDDDDDCCCDDDEDECYACLVNLDEDEYIAFVSNPNYRCPYFRLDDEYSIVRKQN